MNPFDELCKDTIVIRHQDGRTTGPLKAAFSSDTFRTLDDQLDVSEGDLIDRPLPNGEAERYDIAHVKFSQGLDTIPRVSRCLSRSRALSSSTSSHLSPIYPSRTLKGSRSATITPRVSWIPSNR